MELIDIYNILVDIKISLELFIFMFSVYFIYIFMRNFVKTRG